MWGRPDGGVSVVGREEDVGGQDEEGDSDQRLRLVSSLSCKSCCVDSCLMHSPRIRFPDLSLNVYFRASRSLCHTIFRLEPQDGRRGVIVTFSKIILSCLAWRKKSPLAPLSICNRGTMGQIRGSREREEQDPGVHVCSPCCVGGRRQRQSSVGSRFAVCILQHLLTRLCVYTHSLT